MNRVGRSDPAGPATIPQASSGWSARACAMILSTMARSIVSMFGRLPGGALRPPPVPAPAARVSPAAVPDDAGGDLVDHQHERQRASGDGRRSPEGADEALLKHRRSEERRVGTGGSTRVR